MNQNTPTTPTPASTSDRASQAAHNEAFLKHAVDQSPNGMVIVRTKGAYDSSGTTSIADGDGWDHAAVVYKDKQTGEYKVLELVPGKEPVGMGPEVQPYVGDQAARYFGSDNAPRSFSDFSRAYERYEAAPPSF
jgi:hypothetical protein